MGPRHARRIRSPSGAGERARCLVAALLCVVLGAWGTSPAVASCAALQSATENLRDSDAVFMGRADGVSPALTLGPLVLRRQSTAFEVERSWKGVSELRVTIGGDEVPRLDYPFEEGVRYLVYAYEDGDGDDAPLITNGCKQNQPVAEAAAAIRELGPAALQLREGGGRPGAGAMAAPRLLAILGVLSVAVAAVVVQRGARRRSEPSGS